MNHPDAAAKPGEMSAGLTASRLVWKFKECQGTEIERRNFNERSKVAADRGQLRAGVTNSENIVSLVRHAGYRKHMNEAC